MSPAQKKATAFSSLSVNKQESLIHITDATPVINQKTFSTTEKLQLCQCELNDLCKSELIHYMKVTRKKTCLDGL